MSPRPYVRAQVIALAALTVLASLCGNQELGLACAVIGLLTQLALMARYRQEARAPAASIPPPRAALDRLVAGDARLALGAAIVVAVAAVFAPLQLSGQGAVTAGAVGGLLAIAALAVYVSSLVDWYVILPRISGQLGSRPCQSGQPEFAYPHSWKEVTRWWYIHRTAGALLFRVFLSLALATLIGDLFGLAESAQVLAGLAMGIFASYMAAVPSAVLEAAQPKVVVGQTVMVKGRPRRQLVPPFKKIHPPDLDGPQYAVDVSLEGVHLTSAEPHEREELRSPLEFVRYPDRLALANLDSARLAPSRFSGCASRCSGISWYCLQNPACFDPK